MTASARLRKLKSLWRQEQRSTADRFLEERTTLPLSARVAAGLAARNLTVDELGAAPGTRTLLKLSTTEPGGFSDLQAHPGTPVLLWWEQPDEDDVLHAVVSRKLADGRLAVMISGDLPERFDEPGFRLDLDAPQSTFLRGQRALSRFLDAEPRSDTARLREVLFGDRTPRFELDPPKPPLDTALNPPQLDAVALALTASDAALVHGPPGTGKTRTLVEIIRQAAARGESILATAASNAAVDNLAERLVAAGLDIVRLGHPARIAPSVEARSLDVLLESTSGFALARKWMAEANAMRDRARKRTDRGSMRYRERREIFSQAWQLTRDARQQLRNEELRILERAQVICATAAGSDAQLLGKRRFDLVVVDEATQATDPIALVALSRASRVVLAGDPHQLPPTVIDLEAARDGLAQTLFERLAVERPELVRMLKVQHRMHENIMQFPSESMYAGELIAAEAVRHHRLEDLDGVLPDPLRDHPLVFIDSAGKGWEERRTVDDPSTSNPGHAERICAEVRRVIERGIPPSDVAIITPYRAQKKAIQALLGDLLEAGLEVDTVDGFQGREKEAILVDLVRSNPDGELGFLKDTRRMNVSLTRARRFLLVLGDSATLGNHPYYRAFLDSVEVVGLWLSAWDDDAPSLTVG